MRFLLFIFSGLICQYAIGQTQQEIDWIQQNSIEISSNADSESDFGFLDTLLRSKRIVMLGENTHGSAEYFILKNRMIRYLHEYLGYNILAWESSFLDCYAVESQKTQLPSKEMANSSLHFVYRTEQVLPIMDYLKNSDLVLAGFDPQPTVYSDATAKFLGRLDCLSDSIALELNHIDSISQSDSKFVRKKRNREQLAKDYKSLIPLIANSHCSTQLRDILTIGINDRIHFLENWNKGRDERMANNLMWLLYQKYPNQKFIVYAHNAHNDPSNQKNKYANFKTMAGFLPDSVIKQSYNIGIFGYEGRARNNIGESYYDFKTHPELSLENFLKESGFDITFLDVANRTPSDENSFLFKPVNTMYWGNIENPKILSEHYDGVILVNSISPSIKLSR